ncbi:MAG: sulfatase-like hydrolase/transferase [Rhodospirillales bacterium]
MNDPGKNPAAPRPRYDGGWRIAVVYFGLVSLGFAQPLFSAIELFRHVFEIGPFGLFMVVFVFQYLATAALVILRRLLRHPKLRLGLDFLTAAAAAGVMFRQAQMIHFSLLDFSINEKILVLAVMAAAALAAAAALVRFLKPLMFYAGLVSPIFGLFFIYTTLGHNMAGERTLAAGPSSSGPSVLYVLTDELSLDILRADSGEIDAETFPNFARLAARGVWWENAIANYPASTDSFPSFLTSRFPVEPDPRRFEFGFLPEKNLFGRFQDAGYIVHIYSNYFVCAEGRFICYAGVNSDDPDFMFQTFRVFVQHYAPSFIYYRVFRQNLRRRYDLEHAYLIETARAAQPGHFHFAHLSSTHGSYIFNPDGSYKPPPGTSFKPGVDFAAVLEDYRDQIRYVDTVIGQMLDAVDSRPADNPLILMLTADHGICWTDDCPGRDPENTRMIEPPLVNIPAMLLSPLHKPRVDEDDFQLIDVAPTLCEAAGLKGCGDYGFDGVSRLNNPPPPRPRQFFITPDRAPVDIPLPARPVPAPLD